MVKAMYHALQVLKHLIILRFIVSGCNICFNFLAMLGFEVQVHPRVEGFQVSSIFKSIHDYRMHGGHQHLNS
jgi:hypothetical protein